MLTMIMPNVRLSFLCVFAPFSRRKFIHIFTADFQLCYDRLHMSSPGLTRLYRALGTGRGGVGETGYEGVFRGARFSSLPVGKKDCRMKSYADKLFIVFHFSVRSSRSSAHGRHFVIGSKYTVGEGVGVFIVPIELANQLGAGHYICS